MKCSCCGQTCYESKYPEIVFSNKDLVICEECSIDYEQLQDGTIVERTDN